MKITSSHLGTILRRYNEVLKLAHQFIKESHPNSWLYEPIRIDEGGNINGEVNTACHCHPEYEWRVIKTREEFSEWLNKQQTNE